RRTKVAEQFPSEESALLLVTARLRRIHESWQERRYLDVQPLYALERREEARAAVAGAGLQPQRRTLLHRNGCATCRSTTRQPTSGAPVCTDKRTDQGAGEVASAVETAEIVLLRPSYCCALGWCPIATTRRTVKLQFDPNQTYQLDAIRAVVDLF